GLDAASSIPLANPLMAKPIEQSSRVRSSSFPSTTSTTQPSSSISSQDASTHDPRRQSYYPDYHTEQIHHTTSSHNSSSTSGSTISECRLSYESALLNQIDPPPPNFFPLLCFYPFLFFYSLDFDSIPSVLFRTLYHVQSSVLLSFSDSTIRLLVLYMFISEVSLREILHKYGLDDLNPGHTWIPRAQSVPMSHRTKSNHQTSDNAQKSHNAQILYSEEMSVRERIDIEDHARKYISSRLSNRMSHRPQSYSSRKKLGKPIPSLTPTGFIPYHTHIFEDVITGSSYIQLSSIHPGWFFIRPNQIYPTQQIEMLPHFKLSSISPYFFSFLLLDLITMIFEKSGKAQKHSTNSTMILCRIILRSLTNCVLDKPTIGLVRYIDRKRILSLCLRFCKINKGESRKMASFSLRMMLKSALQEFLAIDNIPPDNHKSNENSSCFIPHDPSNIVGLTDKSHCTSSNEHFHGYRSHGTVDDDLSDEHEHERDPSHSSSTPGLATSVKPTAGTSSFLTAQKLFQHKSDNDSHGVQPSMEMGQPPATSASTSIPTSGSSSASGSFRSVLINSDGQFYYDSRTKAELMEYARALYPSISVINQSLAFFGSFDSPETFDLQKFIRSTPSRTDLSSASSFSIMYLLALASSLSSLNNSFSSSILSLSHIDDVAKVVMYNSMSATVRSILCESIRDRVSSEKSQKMLRLLYTLVAELWHNKGLARFIQIHQNRIFQESRKGTVRTRRNERNYDRIKIEVEVERAHQKKCPPSSSNITAEKVSMTLKKKIKSISRLGDGDGLIPSLSASSSSSSSLSSPPSSSKPKDDMDNSDTGYGLHTNLFPKTTMLLEQGYLLSTSLFLRERITMITIIGVFIVSSITLFILLHFRISTWQHNINLTDTVSVLGKTLLQIFKSVYSLPFAYSGAFLSSGICGTDVSTIYCNGKSLNYNIYEENDNEEQFFARYQADSFHSSTFSNYPDTFPSVSSPIIPQDFINDTDDAEDSDEAPSVLYWPASTNPLFIVEDISLLQVELAYYSDILTTSLAKVLEATPGCEIYYSSKGEIETDPIYYSKDSRCILQPLYQEIMQLELFSSSDVSRIETISILDISDVFANNLSEIINQAKIFDETLLSVSSLNDQLSLGMEYASSMMNSPSYKSIVSNTAIITLQIVRMNNVIKDLITWSGNMQKIIFLLSFLFIVVLFYVPILGSIYRLALSRSGSFQLSLCNTNLYAISILKMDIEKDTSSSSLPDKKMLDGKDDERPGGSGNQSQKWPNSIIKSDSIHQIPYSRTLGNRSSSSSCLKPGGQPSSSLSASSLRSQSVHSLRSIKHSPTATSGRSIPSILANPSKSSLHVHRSNSYVIRQHQKHNPISTHLRSWEVEDGSTFSEIPASGLGEKALQLESDIFFSEAKTQHLTILFACVLILGGFLMFVCFRSILLFSDIPRNEIAKLSTSRHLQTYQLEHRHMGLLNVLAFALTEDKAYLSDVARGWDDFQVELYRFGYDNEHNSNNEYLLKLANSIHYSAMNIIDDMSEDVFSVTDELLRSFAFSDEMTEGYAIGNEEFTQLYKLSDSISYPEETAKSILLDDVMTSIVFENNTKMSNSIRAISADISSEEFSLSTKTLTLLYAILFLCVLVFLSTLLFRAKNSPFSESNKFRAINSVLSFISIFTAIWVSVIIGFGWYNGLYDVSHMSRMMNIRETNIFHFKNSLMMGIFQAVRAVYSGTSSAFGHIVSESKHILDRILFDFSEEGMIDSDMKPFFSDLLVPSGKTSSSKPYNHIYPLFKDSDDIPLKIETIFINYPFQQMMDDINSMQSDMREIEKEYFMSNPHSTKSGDIPVDCLSFDQKNTILTTYFPSILEKMKRLLRYVDDINGILWQYTSSETNVSRSILQKVCMISVLTSLLTMVLMIFRVTLGVERCSEVGRMLKDLPPGEQKTIDKSLKNSHSTIKYEFRLIVSVLVGSVIIITFLYLRFAGLMDLYHNSLDIFGANIDAQMIVMNGFERFLKVSGETREKKNVINIHLERLDRIMRKGCNYVFAHSMSDANIREIFVNNILNVQMCGLTKKVFTKEFIEFSIANQELLFSTNSNSGIENSIFNDISNRTNINTFNDVSHNLSDWNAEGNYFSTPTSLNSSSIADSCSASVSTKGYSDSKYEFRPVIIDIVNNYLEDMIESFGDESDTIALTDPHEYPDCFPCSNGLEIEEGDKIKYLTLSSDDCSHVAPILLREDEEGIITNSFFAKMDAFAAIVARFSGVDEESRLYNDSLNELELSWDWKELFHMLLSACRSIDMLILRCLRMRHDVFFDPDGYAQVKILKLLMDNEELVKDRIDIHNDEENGVIDVI
ncbi:hypothetical protein ADUPG1_007728, partial [Aduncisulcus paluster]